MRGDGVFIAIEVDDAALEHDPKLAAHLTQVCPVDIYRQAADGGLEIVGKNIDECVLCRLCLDLSSVHADDGSVRVLKLYDGAVAL